MRIRLIQLAIIAASLLMPAYSNASETSKLLAPKRDLEFNETREMKDVSGHCALGIHLAIKTYNTFVKQKNIRHEIGKDTFIRGAFCDLSGNKDTKRFVAILLASDVNQERPEVDGQVIVYFDANMKIVEWGY